MQIRIFGDRDPDTLDSSHGLQLVLANLGMREDALALLKSVAAGRKAVLGAAHPLTLRSRASLLTMLSADELTQNGGELLSLPSDCIRHLGPEHTVTLNARHNHAWALYVLGQFEEADEAIQQVCQAYRDRFGPDYPIALAAQQLHAPARSLIDAATVLGVAVNSAAHRTVSCWYRPAVIFNALAQFKITVFMVPSVDSVLRDRLRVIDRISRLCGKRVVMPGGHSSFHLRVRATRCT